MRYSSFVHWISRTWLAFMDESQQYGNYHEIAALAAIQQPMLTVFIGDHRQTPGGYPKAEQRLSIDVNCCNGRWGFEHLISPVTSTSTSGSPRSSAVA